MKDPKIEIKSEEILSQKHYTYKKVTLQYTDEKKSETQTREVLDRGNGATILLYNKENQSVVLVKQFRLPTFLNKNKSGMLIEACAGMLEEENPEDTIKREVQEETGYTIHSVKKIFQAYMSPGAVTEIIHFFVGEYSKEMKTGKGGGLESEHENIEILEINFEKAIEMIASGEIEDAKTIMLLQYAKIHNLL